MDSPLSKYYSDTKVLVKICSTHTISTSMKIHKLYKYCCLLLVNAIINFISIQLTKLNGTPTLDLRFLDLQFYFSTVLHRKTSALCLLARNFVLYAAQSKCNKPPQRTLTGLQNF